MVSCASGLLGPASLTFWIGRLPKIVSVTTARGSTLTAAAWISWILVFGRLVGGRDADIGKGAGHGDSAGTVSGIRITSKIL